MRLKRDFFLRVRVVRSPYILEIGHFTMLGGISNNDGDDNDNATKKLV